MINGVEKMIWKYYTRHKYFRFLHRRLTEKTGSQLSIGIFTYLDSVFTKYIIGNDWCLLLLGSISMSLPQKGCTRTWWESNYTTKKLGIFVIFNRYFWTSTYHHYVLERLGNVIMACLSTLTLFFDCATRPSSLKVALACVAFKGQKLVYMCPLLFLQEQSR